MRYLLVIVFIATSLRSAQEKPIKFRCLQRVYARFHALFNSAKIIPYQPKDADALQQFTPSMRQAIYNPEKLMSRVIDLDEINQRDKGGKTILHWLAQHGKEDSMPLLQKLVALKADIDIQSNNGYTPLMCAVHAPWPEKIMQLLIEMRADVTVRDKLGNDVKKLIQESAMIHDKNILYALLEERERRSSGCAIE